MPESAARTRKSSGPKSARPAEPLFPTDEWYRIVFEEGPIGVVLVDRQRRFVKANPAFCRMLGYTPEELRGLTFLEITHPDDRERDDLNSKRVLAGKIDYYRTEKRYVAKSGEIRWAYIFGRLIREAKTRPPRYTLALIVDITERKEAEAGLKESEEKLRLLLDNSLDAILLTIPEGRILTANPAACRMFGRTEDEICRGGRSLIIDLTDPRAPAAVEERARTGRFHGELTGLRADGAKFPIEISSSVFRDGRGRLRTSMTIHDLSARKRAEAALAAERQRLFNVLETLPAMVCLLTPDHRIAFANRSFRDKFGESIGRYCYEFCFGLPAPCSFCKAYDVLKTGRPQHWECTVKGGSILEVFDVPFTDSDGSPLILELDIDITARIRAEEELKDNHEQLQALSAKLETAREEEKANIAREIHDELGQRLTGLIMDLAILSKKIPQGEATLKDTVTAISSEALDLVAAVRKIATDLRPGILDDMGLVAAVEWLAEDFQSRTGIRCGYESGLNADEIEPRCAIGVFRILQEALTNIARHAGARRVAIGMHKEGGEIFLDVEDDGRGITAAESEGRQSLGLAGMRERARLMDGSIEISGTPGKGTRLRLRFPVKAPGPRT